MLAASAAGLLAFTVWVATAPPVEAAPAPTVTSVVPATGTNAGSTAVTITGSGFVAGASVLFAGNPATNVTVVSATQITADTPAGTPGPAVVAVTNADTQSGTLTNGFTYLITPPTVTLIAPVSGTSLGGTAVTITGTDFAAGATVAFGGTAATGVTIVSPTQITATTPAHTAAVVDVVVTSHDGQPDTLVGGYTFVAAAAPTVTSVSPASGTTGGATPVTITGTGFAAGATVAFDGIAATAVSVASATEITATAPAHTAGAVSVLVTNADTQSGTIGSGYTYIATAAPTVTVVSPSAGPLSGGSFVTVAGTGFLPGATVTFGGTTGTAVSVLNTTALTVITPTHVAGAVEVKVENTDQQTGSLAAGFTYQPAPAISNIAPATGFTTGGETVTVSGSGFVTGATVTFGSVAATSVTFSSASRLTATAPPHTAGIAAIVVSNTDGQIGVKADGYTYTNAPPTVSSVGPSAGISTGGATVEISGTGFAAGATVKFGDTAASSVTFVNATTLTAVTPEHDAGAVAVVVTVSGQSGTLADAYTFEDPAPVIVGGQIPATGIGLIVFSGGTSNQLVTAALASGCTDITKLRFFAITPASAWVVLIPAALIDAVNAAWNEHFAAGISYNAALVVRCD